MDSGEFVLRFRMPPGTNYELTRQTWVRVPGGDRGGSRPENVQISMGFAGQQAPNYGVNNMLLFMRGPDDGQMRVALRGHGVPPGQFRETAAQAFPDKLNPWFAERLQREGLPTDAGRAAGRADRLRLRAGRHGQRGDELRLAGPHRDRPGQPRTWRRRGHHADRVLNEMHKITVSPRRADPADAGLPHRAQSIIDRQKAGLSGMDAKKSANRCW